MKSKTELDVDEWVAFFRQFSRKNRDKVMLDTIVLGVFDFSSLLKSGNLSCQMLIDTLLAEKELLDKIKPIFMDGGFVF